MKQSTMPGPVRLAIAVLGSLVLMVVGAVAYAAFPTTDGVVSACVTKPGGVIRIIDPATQSCKKGEVPLAWNQQGVPGEDGLLSPDDLYVRTANVSSDFPDGSHSVRADCDPGDELLGADGVAVLDSSRWTLDRVSNAGGVRGMLVRVWPTEAGVDPVASVRALCLDTAQ